MYENGFTLLQARNKFWFFIDLRVVCILPIMNHVQQQLGSVTRGKQTKRK
jgi:hypothetical protein